MDQQTLDPTPGVVTRTTARTGRDCGIGGRIHAAVRAKVQELIDAHNELRADHDELIDAHNDLVDVHNDLATRFEQSVATVRHVTEQNAHLAAAVDELMPHLESLADANRQLLERVTALQAVVDRQATVADACVHHRQDVETYRAS